MTEEGAYLPGVFERVIEVEEAFTLTKDLALHLRATENITFMGRKRQPGDEWLITAEEVESLIPPIGVVCTEPSLYCKDGSVSKMCRLGGCQCKTVTNSGTLWMLSLNEVTIKVPNCTRIWDKSV